MDLDQTHITHTRTYCLNQACYTHAFHMRGKGPDSCAVYYEKPGSVNWVELKAANISMDDLIRHIIFNLEFLYNHIEPNDMAKTITVIDLAGAWVDGLMIGVCTGSLLLDCAR